MPTQRPGWRFSRRIRSGSRPRRLVAEGKAAFFKESCDTALKSVEEVSSSLKDTAEKLATSEKEAGALKAELDDVQTKLTRATVSLHQDYTNSCITSARSPYHQVNSRKPTGRKPGGQPGHEGHGPRYVDEDHVDEHSTVPDDEYAGNPERFVPTDRFARAQSMDMHVDVSTTEYSARIYTDRETGREVHAPFPDGLHPGFNLSPRTKALLFLMNNYCNMSYNMISKFIDELSGTKLNISTGYLYNLNREFTEKSESFRESVWEEIHKAKCAQGDYTSVRCPKEEGSPQAPILICATPGGQTLFTHPQKKGLFGIKGSPLEHYQGIVVSDSEATFVFNCGEKHQRCLEHAARQAEAAVQHENAEWAKHAQRFFQESIHFKNEVSSGNISKEELKKKVAEFEEDYQKILDEGAEFYKDGQPLKGFSKGINLYRAMRDYPDHYLLFLRVLREEEIDVPPTNNNCELGARRCKRKNNAAGAFRSDEGVENFCNSQTVIVTVMKTGKNLVDEIAGIFALPSPRAGNRRGVTRKHMDVIQEEMERWQQEQAGTSGPE